jgi:hypothetical protein
MQTGSKLWVSHCTIIAFRLGKENTFRRFSSKDKCVVRVGYTLYSEFNKVKELSKSGMECADWNTQLNFMKNQEPKYLDWYVDQMDEVVTPIS